VKEPAAEKEFAQSLQAPDMMLVRNPYDADALLRKACICRWKDETGPVVLHDDNQKTPHNADGRRRRSWHIRYDKVETAQCIKVLACTGSI